MMIEKKTIEISGRPMYPIVIGQYAWISEGDGIRRTSPVVNLEHVSSAEMRFETMNTHYHLRLSEGSAHERV